MSATIIYLAQNYLVTFGWALTGAISMGLGLGLALRLFTAFTPGLNEMEELKKGNVAVAVVLAAVVVAMGIVIAVTVMPSGFSAVPGT